MTFGIILVPSMQWITFFLRYTYIRSFTICKKKLNLKKKTFFVYALKLLCPYFVFWKIFSCMKIYILYLFLSHLFLFYVLSMHLFSFYVDANRCNINICKFHDRIITSDRDVHSDRKRAINKIWKCNSMLKLR